MRAMRVRARDVFIEAFPEAYRWLDELLSDAGMSLSRDCWDGQRIGDALAVEIDDGVMDGLVEGVERL